MITPSFAVLTLGIIPLQNEKIFLLHSGNLHGLVTCGFGVVIVGVHNVVVGGGVVGCGVVVGGVGGGGGSGSGGGGVVVVGGRRGAGSIKGGHIGG